MNQTQAVSNNNHIFNYSYFRYPRVLMTDPELITLSAGAKVLISLIMDRMLSSARNADKFTHTDGRLYVIFTVSEISRELSCSSPKAVAIVNELVSRGYIDKVRCGQGKPNRIMLKNYFLEFFNRYYLKSDEFISEDSDFSTPDVKEFSPNHNNINNNNTNQNNINHSYSYNELIERIEDQIEVDCFAPEDKDILNSIVFLMADILSSVSGKMKICGATIDVALIQKRFEMLNSDHIDYVISSIKNCKNKVHNIHSYLLSLLYTAPTLVEPSVCADFSYHYTHGN